MRSRKFNMAEFAERMLFLLLAVTLMCFIEWIGKRLRIYDKLIVIRLKKAKNEYRKSRIYETLSTDPYRDLGLSLFVMFVVVGVFMCSHAGRFEYFVGILRVNLQWFCPFVVVAFILPFWLCGLRGRYFRFVASLLKNAKKMFKTDGILGVWATGMPHRMELIVVPIFWLCFFCVSGLYFYSSYASNYDLACDVLEWRAVFVVFSALGVMWFFLRYLCSSPRNIVLKNNILTITTGFYWRRKEIIYRLENIEDAKFCYETGRYRGQSSKHTCGGLYIKTTGEVAYKVYSVSQHLRIVEVETLIYLIHMIKQNEPDILVEINMEYITALREEYILSTEDAAKIDPRRIDEEIKREELKRRREEKKKRNTKGNKIK